MKLNPRSLSEGFFVDYGLILPVPAFGHNLFRYRLGEPLNREQILVTED
jgi:hypothetical protein